MWHFIASHIELVELELGMVAIFATLWAIPHTRSLAHRLIRTGKALARNRTLPLWARYGFIVATLPIPGPFDEIVGALLALALMKGRHAPIVRAAWNASAQRTEV